MEAARLANLGTGLMSDPAEAGKKAVDGWVGAVASGDAAAIAKVLAPEFQIVRSDGTAYGAEEYLQSEFPRFPEPPQIGTLVVTGHGDHLVARYEINSKIMLGEETELRHAPRLTVFRKGPTGRGWSSRTRISRRWCPRADAAGRSSPPERLSPLDLEHPVQHLPPVGHAERDAVRA